MISAEVVIGIVSLICFECFPLQIIGIFGSGDALYQEFAVMTFRIYLCMIILCCIQKSTSVFLQALGKPVLSTVLSLLREIILSVPLVLILPVFFGVKGPLFSAPIADIISFLVTVLFMRRVLKNL
jgi:Na+-driven multidrug efflux pump